MGILYNSHMKYVALLRGINVGGNNKVEMIRLKKIFEDLGYSQVKTYINSGNIIFSTSESHSSLTGKIEKAIEEEFKLHIKVVVKSLSEITKIDGVIPKTWTNGGESKTDVLFLWNEINKKEALHNLKIKPEIDHVKYIDGAIIWNVDRKNITKSGLLKIVGTDFYKKVTIRNVNTLRKLKYLMEENKT